MMAFSNIFEFYRTFMTLSVWHHFSLVPAHEATSDIFGFAEYLSAMALLLVVLAASDFRFQYRLSVTKMNLLKAGSWIGFGVGLLILIVDVWFQNQLPVPKIVADENNLKACLAVAFLFLLFKVISVSILRPPIFRKSNAKQFFEANYRYIHEGNPERLQVVANELRRSIKSIFAYAAGPMQSDESGKNTPLDRSYALNLLLLIADKRFCKIVVDTAPAFAFVVFLEAQRSLGRKLPIFQFARNIGQEFIRNTNSSFYQEDSGYYSGLLGYERPATKIVFGHYEFIESCASDGASPIETDLEFGDINPQQMEGFCRASLAFFESYIKKTGGCSFHHSYALARLLGSFETAVRGVYQLNAQEQYFGTAAYFRLRATVEFIVGSLKLVGKHAKPPRKLRVPGHLQDNDIFDDLAYLIFSVIFAASQVSRPSWTSWDIQHNAVWGEIFGVQSGIASKIVGYKVRRLLYNEIVEMDRFANFKGARILGYCMHVLGLSPIDRRAGFRKEFFPLQTMALRWARANFGRLYLNHPKVAEACLQGSISYDVENRRLVQTYPNEIGAGPYLVYLHVN